jgi:hypothetical protein
LLIRAACRLRDLPKEIFKHPAVCITQLDTLDLLPRDQPAVERLSQGLPEKHSLNCIGFNQIENSSKGSSMLEALTRLYVLSGQVRIVQHKNARNFAVSPEVGWDGHE